MRIRFKVLWFQLVIIHFMKLSNNTWHDLTLPEPEGSLIDRGPPMSPLEVEAGDWRLSAPPWSPGREDEVSGDGCDDWDMPAPPPLPDAPLFDGPVPLELA